MEAETKFLGILEAAPDAILGVDPDGRIVFVNAQAESLFGYLRDELLGEPIEMLVPVKAQVVHPSHRQRYLKDSRPRPMGAGMELAGRRKDGSEFPAEISLSAIDTDEGQVVAAAIRDVTDRKRADAKFRGLLESAPDAILGIDSDGCIALVNAQAERLFGYNRDELLGQSVDILVPEHARAVHPGHRSRYFSDPRPRPMGAGMQLAARRKDGSEFPAEISLNSLLTEEGVLVSAAVRDVTERIEAQAERERLQAQAERERLERRVHQSQRLESLGQLAGGVAHDFNNLLAVILNYTSLIAEDLPEGGPESQRWEALRRDVEQVRRAAERGALLTHQLLAFARREVVRPQVMSINEVISDSGQFLQRTLGEEVHLVVSAAPDLWPVLADPGQIEQVLVNLAVNARDAMPQGGQLTIDTANTISDEPDTGFPTGRCIRLRVSDTGTGMDQETAARAFEPFFTTKSKAQGSGLGLATVYGIITQAGGEVRIFSEPGLGTTVRVLLPATDEVGSQPDAVAAMQGEGGGETILVVEDEEAMREVTCRILGRKGYDVLAASGGAEALTLVKHHGGTIDLLLTDVVMPQMLGKEVASAVRSLRPDIRVLFMSGYAPAVLTSKGTLEEGVTLLEKPFAAPDLLDKVREALDS